MTGNSLRILVAGGGIAGQALAFWLTRGGHRVTVAERHPAVRASGAQVDLRGQGIEAVRRMGLLEAVRGKLVDEAGVAFVDARGRAKATIMANTSGRGRQTPCRLRLPDLAARFAKDDRGGGWQLPASPAPTGAA